MGPNLRGMGYPGPMPSMGRDRDGTGPSWDGTSRPGPTASLIGVVNKLHINMRKIIIKNK